MQKGNGILAAALVLCLVLACFAVLQPWEQTDAPLDTAHIIISEICAKNDCILPDNDGRYRDYIELYNPGEAVDLQGYILTDGSRKSQIESTFLLPAQGYRVLFLADELTGFALSASGGDCIQLLSPQGDIITQTNISAMAADQVMLYSGGLYTLSDQPSPGFANDAKGLAAFRNGSEDGQLPLVISEVLTQNVSSLPDETGAYSDAIELCNISDQSISLGGWCLSDSSDQRFRWRLPDVTLTPGEYLVIFCDGQNYISGQAIHANFGLSAGETLYLTSPDGGYTALQAQFPGEDISLALSDGSYISAAVSLGWPNTDQGAAQFTSARTDTESALIISEVLLSAANVPYDGGFRDVVEITNRSNETVSTQGWYISDGGDSYACPLPQAHLAPGQCLVMVCDEASTGFSLSTGESLRLTAPDHRHAPLVPCAALEGQSLTWLEGSYVSSGVSLGFANTDEGCAQYAQQACPEGLMIREVMSSNASYLKGPYATTCDWVELYNNSDEAISLSGYFLSDDPDALHSYPLPDTTLESGKACVIFLSTQTENLLKGYPVLPFSLNAEGEGLYLSTAQAIVDSVYLPALGSDSAWGRAQGEAGFSVLAKAAPGKANSAPAAISPAPEAITAQGVYSNAEYIDVILSGPGTIYYTTDCTAPNQYDKRYEGPIRIKKTTVIRAMCMEESKKASDILDLTYILNEGDSLPVISLVTEPKNLWNEKSGIYVEGLGGAEKYPHKGANYWMDWEKPASVSLFELDGSGFSSACGIKIYGAYSRAQPKKSLSVFFRGKYGASQLDYALFGEDGVDTYESFLLRAGGQDAYRAMMRDELITSLVSAQTGVASQMYRPVVVYLNGEYWGLHYIREKISEHYVAANYNVSPDTVTLAERNGNTSKSYKALVEYAATHDLSKQENYDHIRTLMDVDVYMDYIIAQIYIGNSDNSNVRFFTTTEGKWTWILYDTDLGMQDPAYDSVADHLNPGGTGAANYISTTLINALLKNPDFRDAFLKRMAWQLDHIWSQENINAGIDTICALIAADMEKDTQRWGNRYSTWENNVSQLRSFAAKRTEYLTGYIQKYFDLTKQEMRQYGF